MKDTIGAALTKLACPVCGEYFDGDIIINTRLNKSQANKVRQLHGECIGFLDEPCDECKEHMKLGIKIIVIDENKTDDITNPYRTGHQFVVKEEAIERIIVDKDKTAAVLKKRAMFLSIKDAEQIGLIR